METIKNAKIKYSFLGIDETETLTFYLGFEYRGETTWKNVSTQKIVLLDISLIKDLLMILEVRSYEELSRKFARIKIKDDKVIAIGNLLEDKWMEIK